MKLRLPILCAFLPVYFIGTVCFGQDNSATGDSAKRPCFRFMSDECQDYLSNDNNPFDDARSVPLRDDNGLTFAFGLKNDALFLLKNKKQLDFGFTNFDLNYTRPLGTTTQLNPGDDEYSFYEYLRKLHPDWDAVYLTNLNSISKYYNCLTADYVGNFMTYSLGVGYISLDVGSNQLLSDVQKTYHKWFYKILKNRNYYYPDIYANKFDGQNVSYLFLSPAVYAEKNEQVFDGAVDIMGKAGVGVNINLIRNSLIPGYMPFFDSYLNLDFIKAKVQGKKKISVDMRLFVDPKEILPLAADPGCIGYITPTFRINFYGRKRMGNPHKKMNIEYYLIPYELNMPIHGKNDDNVLGYHRPSSDKGYVESFFNFGVKLVRK